VSIFDFSCFGDDFGCLRAFIVEEGETVRIGFLWSKRFNIAESLMVSITFLAKLVRTFVEFHLLLLKILQTVNDATIQTFLEVIANFLFLVPIETFFVDKLLFTFPTIFFLILVCFARILWTNASTVDTAAFTYDRARLSCLVWYKA
jgi:hypothetical protein